MAKRESNLFKLGGNNSVKPVNLEPEVEEPIKEIITEKENVKMEEPAVETKEKTVIEKGTVIKGDITSELNLVICGDIEGKVTGSGLVLLRDGGTVKGNITAKDIHVAGGNVTGDLFIENGATINSFSNISGNIKADHAHLDAAIVGNLTIAKDLHLGENAKVIGDITAELLTVLSGAKINGKLDIKANGE